MARSPAAVVPACTALIFAALTALVVLRADPVIGFDAAVDAAALRTALAHPAWRSSMLAVTNTGGPVGVTIAAVVVAVALLLGLRRLRDALFVAAAVLGPVLLRLIVLAAVARPRPPERLAPSAGWSYPSGHTTASASAALALVLVLWPHLTRPWQRYALAVAAGGWAVAVGVSRVALTVHWATDVVGAWLFTATIVLLLPRVRAASTADRRAPSRF